MENLLLYIVVVLVWGSTWFAIKFQLGSVDPTISVLYRFALAAGICLVLNLIKKNTLLFNRKQHFLFFIQGFCLYSMNYLFFYRSEQYIPSGLVAATFTLIIYFNIVGQKFYFKVQPTKQVYLSAFLGGSGILFLFFDQITNFNTDFNGVLGLGLGLAGTVFASTGNLISAKIQKGKIPVLASNFWGMLYGTAITLVIALLSGASFQFNLTSSYWLSLGYLSVFGTVIAFQAYLTLIGRIGASRAAYANIITPILALGLSSVFEQFVWQWNTILGAALCLLGNVFALRKSSNKS